MVEGISEQSAESILNPDSEEPEFGIMQVTRYGIQVATHIAQTGESALEIQKTDLLKTDSGDTVMHMNILNDGDLMVRPDVWVEVYDPAGEPVGRFEGSPNRLYPGTSIRQQIALGSLPPGSYRALVIMDAGDDAVFGAEYDLAVN